MFDNSELITDILPNKLILRQPINGFRSGSDALLLVDYFLSTYSVSCKNNLILDVGCGAGAISLSLLKHNPHIKVTGLEIQEDYCDLAKLNLLLNDTCEYSLKERFNCIHGDLENIQHLLPPDTFDFIITNPPFYNPLSGRTSPYISKKIAHHGTINLIEWIKKSLYCLKNKGFLILICRTERLGDIYTALDKRAGNIYIKPIVTGKNDYAKRIIISCQKATKGGTKIIF